MSENSEISSLYPPPPPYYKFFNNENIEKFNQLKAEDPNTNFTNIENLKFLVPPEKPDNKEQYRSFGELWWFKDKTIGLKESGIQQIYPESEQKINSDEDEEEFTQARIDELKKMTKSLLLNYLQLIGLLSKNPSLAQTKIDQIRIILINIHHLLNSYRSHQSRESLILKMQTNLSNIHEEIDSIKSTINNVNFKVDSLVAKLKSLDVINENQTETFKNEPGTEQENGTTHELFKEEVSQDLRNEAVESLLKNIS